MSSPRHSPPPSAAAPRPKGILKNASETSTTQLKDAENAPMLDENGNRLAWDESNLTLHEIERETQAARMKIDEPKTPFVRSASLGPMDEDAGTFDLDSQSGPSYFPDGNGGKAETTTSDVASSNISASTAGRRSSAAEQLAANTMANAGRRASNAGSATSSGGGDKPSTAVGLDSVDLAASSGGLSSNSRRSDSRSPSFTLPSSRRSSAAGDRSRDGVREEMRNRDDGMEGLQQDEGTFEEEDLTLDPEAKAKQAAFAQKRNAHYGNEAEAMRVAAALAAQEEEEDEDDEGQPHSIPPVPPLVNGRAN